MFLSSLKNYQLRSTGIKLHSGIKIFQNPLVKKSFFTNLGEVKQIQIESGTIQTQC